MDQFFLVLATLLISTAGERVHVLGEGSIVSQKRISATVKVSLAELQISLRSNVKKNNLKKN